ncbi:MAG: hypothetical protein ACK504_01000 [Bacteroidota bacterium]
MIKHSTLNKIIELNQTILDRYILHQKVAPLLIELGSDLSFWSEVIKLNLTDKNYLNRKWSMYEIPFFYVYECEDFNMKVHIFPSLESKETNILASAIHHHNNYLLTSYATFGSGYETFLFDKNPITNEITKETNLKIRDQFKQKDKLVHLVDSWEPHAVVNPESFSATLVFWSPDKKRKTDILRSNPLLKLFKIPIRKLIYTLGLDKKIGIAAKNTYQWYPHNHKFIGVLEDEFFAPTKAMIGEEVNNYSVQSIFYLIQNIGFEDYNFIKSLKTNKNVPNNYHKWIDLFINKEPIPETFAKQEINVPNKKITIEDLLLTNQEVNHI